MLKLLLACAVISISFDMGFSTPDSRSTGKLTFEAILLLKIFYFSTAWIEGTAIFLAVFVVATVGSFNDYKKEG